MKHFIVRLLAISSLLLAVLVPIAMAQPGSFTGAWVGTDPAPPAGDGSNLRLTISGGSTVHVAYFDDNASVACPTDVEGEGHPAMFRARGTIAGDTLTVTDVQVYCFNRGRTEGPFLASIEYTYDPATDTITDDFGGVFHRAGGRPEARMT